MIFPACLASFGIMADSVWADAGWPAPDWLHAGTSRRTGGVSKGRFAGLNLAMHVNDKEDHVHENRRRLAERLALPATPQWLEQVHGTDIIDLDSPATGRIADAAVTSTAGVVCAILTADCVPVLLCNPQAKKIAAVHAGWRRISRGIITVAAGLFAPDPHRTMAWIGPHISARHYEIDAPVHDACLQSSADYDRAFIPSRSGHWYADLGRMVDIALRHAGCRRIYHNNDCTFANDTEYYSHRRDGVTGRMATLIWMDP